MKPATAANLPNADRSAENKSAIDLSYLVRALIKYNASDLHLKAGRPPLFRINGRLIPAKMAILDQESISSIIHSFLTPKQVEILREKLQLDLSFTVGNYGRFRANVFFQKGNLATVIRMIPMQVPSIDDLGLPAVLKDVCQRHRGLVLITGATGSGKSTTLSAMVQYINESRFVHVVTIEDPIEYIFRDQKASITQREIGSDTHSLNEALFSGLRQDPDVIVLGELRDAQTIQTALTAAETGHLVMTTLHTNDCVSTIERILDVFPAESKNQIRLQLAASLVAVVSQNLLIRADGAGRIPACEVMINSPTISRCILKNDLLEIPQAIAQSNSYYRMQSLNQDLERLVGAKLITADEAVKVSRDTDDLNLRFSGVVHEQDYSSD